MQSTVSKPNGSKRPKLSPASTPQKLTSDVAACWKRNSILFTAILKRLESAERDLELLSSYVLNHQNTLGTVVPQIAAIEDKLRAGASIKAYEKALKDHEEVSDANQG